MTRLTPARQKEIRYLAETCCESITHTCNTTLKLLDEIDALRAYFKIILQKRDDRRSNPEHPPAFVVMEEIRDICREALQE